MNNKKLAYFLSSAVLFSVPGHLLAAGCAYDLYIGSYTEDASTNPEDPMPGAIHVSIPKDDGDFSGELFFTYVGCQSENIGSVTGTKQTKDEKTTLNGLWQGRVDNRPQQGEFKGQLNSKGNFTGTYTVAAGKQKVVVEDCVEYYIAPKGTWFLHPTTTSLDDEAFISIDGNRVSWEPKAGSHMTQCQLIDRGIDPCVDEQKVVWQNITLSRLKSMKIQGYTMKNDHSYLASCSQFNKKQDLLELSQLQFTYPLAEKPDPTAAK